MPYPLHTHIHFTISYKTSESPELIKTDVFNAQLYTDNVTTSTLHRSVSWNDSRVERDRQIPRRHIQQCQVVRGGQGRLSALSAGNSPGALASGGCAATTLAERAGAGAATACGGMALPLAIVDDPK